MYSYKKVCIVHGNYVIDGNSEHSAMEQTRYSIFWRHLVTSKETSEKTYFTSYVRNKFLATILYKYHGIVDFRFNVRGKPQIWIRPSRKNPDPDPQPWIRGRRRGELTLWHLFDNVVALITLLEFIGPATPHNGQNTKFYISLYICFITVSKIGQYLWYLD